MPPGTKHNDFEARLYRAKRNRACDSCRKRKARCDGYEMLDNVCTTCAMYGVECTYFESSKKPTSQSYVRELENKLAQVERLIREVSNPESQSSKSILEARKEKNKQSVTTGPSMDHARPSPPFARVPQVGALRPLPEADEHDDDDFVALYDPKKGSLESHKEGVTPKFFGESSVFTFPQALGQSPLSPRVPSRHRLEFWAAPTWLLPALRGPRMNLVFPEPSLMRHLLDIYFDIHNIVLPILHRPTFERSFSDKLHERNESFGAVVILMCAIACRHSDDPRIKHPIVTSTSNTGWKLYNQVDRLGRPRLVGHQLYDVQIYALAACFLDGYSLPQTPWLMVGIGLRVMQELGVHRRRFTVKKSVENELWKRCFWVLVIMDRTFSNLLGRSCAIQDEDFDLDLPLNCDDEYLEHPDPEKAFKQPADMPSKMDYFISMIRLNQIVGFSQRTLYSTRKSRSVLGYVGNRWESRIISSLEGALKKWFDSVPPHLRWDVQKNQTNMTWLRQALSLAGNYYELQIIIHRPFIARPDPTLSEPAWVACNKAAKNCVVAFGSVKDKLNGRIRFHPYAKPMFVAAIFLLLQFHGRGIDQGSELYKAIMTVKEMVEEVGSNWTTGKRLIGVLNAALILCDSQYTGWKPGKEDLIDLELRMLCFVDEYGRLSFGDEGETVTDSYGSTSSENIPSPQSVPSVECSMSESSPNDPSAESPDSIEADPTRLGLNTVLADDKPSFVASEAGPGPIMTTEPRNASVPTNLQPSSIPETSGAPGNPPPQDGKFFSNPANLRTLMTGSGDGYRSPEPPSRLGTISPFYSLRRERPTLDEGATSSPYNPLGAATEQPGLSFSVQQSGTTQSLNGPSLDMGYGYEPPPALSSSSVLPVELMVYNDLMTDIATAQYLEAELQGVGPPFFVHPSMSTNEAGGVDGFGSNTSGYQWQGVSQNTAHGPPQTMPHYGYPQPGQPQHGAHTAAQRMGTDFRGQWPTGGITDYDAWERTLYENFMMGQQANHVSQY